MGKGVGAGRWAGPWLAALCGLVASGCFTHAKVPGRALSVAREAPLSGDFVLEGSSGDSWWKVERFDPATAVRFEVQGKWSPWVYAGNLEVSDDGFVFGQQTLGWDQATEVSAQGLDDGALLGLAACLPPRTAAGVSLAAPPQALSQALRCIDEAQQRLGGPVPGTWKVTFGGQGEVGGLTFAQLAAGQRSGFPAASGLRFSAIDRVEASNFNASLTAVTVVVVAALVTGAVLAGGSGCNTGGCGSGDFGHGDGSPPTVRPNSPALFLGLSGPAPSLQNRRRLFTEAEARRSTARLYGWVDLTTRLEALKWASVTPGFGVRLAEVFEVGAGLSLYWGEPLRTLPVQNTPLGVPESAQVPSVMPTVRMLLNFELDPYRRVSLPLGVDVGMGLNSAVQVRLRWGARVRLWHLRLGLYPFCPTYSDGLGTLTPPWTFPTTFEVGAEW